MCIICIEYQKQLITINEARRILSEMSPEISDKHLSEIEELLSDEDEEQLKSTSG